MAPKLPFLSFSHTHHHTLYLLHPYSHALPLVYMCMCTYVHITFLRHELSSALVAPYILPSLIHLFFLFLFTCFVSACAMLHISVYSSLIQCCGRKSSRHPQCKEVQPILLMVADCT